LIVIDKNNHIHYFVIGINCKNKILLCEVDERLRTNRLRISREEFINNFKLPSINECTNYIYNNNFQYNVGKNG
jgi:hypothetical protein